MVNKRINQNIVIFQAKSGAIELSVDAQKETVWANLQQIADVFGVDKSGISRHINNIFESGELNKKATVAKNATVQKEGNREVLRDMEYFNLDLILSVGYRVNSKQATNFRIWATKTLRSYIVDGFAINKNRIAKNYEHFLSVVSDVKKLLPAESSVDPKDAIELVSLFADTWLSLDAYDRDILPKGKLTKKKVDITVSKIVDSLDELKTELMRREEATELFGVEKNKGSIAGIVGNVMQTFGGKELYPTIEEKAANLLYFIVKNHPFNDGNKRSGAFAFVWFLKQANILNVSKITPSALTALTILVASSDPKEKEKVVSLIVSLISK